MIKAVVFDFDYTLGDSTKGIALSINYALLKLGYSEKNLDEIRKTIGLSLKETYAVLTKQDNPDEAGQFAVLFKEKADQVMAANAELYEGAKEVLQKLQDRCCRTAIVTTKFHYRIEQILGKFDAMELIDMIVGAEDVKIEKPDPEGLLWTVSHLGIEKEEVLYVGDSLVDAKTAANAGILFAGVLTGTTSRADFEPYSHVYIGNDVSDVYDYMQNQIIS